jgi:4-cresol dehydrogenase (hydroxylating) flavoprotein subunit
MTSDAGRSTMADGLSTVEAVAAAVAEWRSAIGAANVSIEPSDLVRSGIATFQTHSTVAAILRPGNREDVQQCVRIANRFRVALYPVSAGKNWGYGSRSPVRDAVLLDLGRLNRILELNEDLAYVTLEPGVTQRQLHEHLNARGSRLWMDATGASPESSIIGNTLERGFGHTPMGDHVNHVSGFEVVLPSGDYIETGFGRFEHSSATAVSKWGVGPALDGLFAQSNLGIVTRMTVWLMPAPERYCAFFFQSDRDIADIVDALRPLRVDGTLRSVAHIGNDYKVLSSSGQYPWTETGGRTPLSREMMARLRSTLRIGRWNGSGGLYGTRGQVREAQAALRRALSRVVSRLTFVDDRTVRWFRRIERPYSVLTRRTDLSRALRVVPPLLDLLKGTPTKEFLASAYWRKKTVPPADPDLDRDKCGLLWASPVAPNIGRDVKAMADIAEDTALHHGFEPLISVSLITERSTTTTISLTYDRDVPGEDARAMACYRDMLEKLIVRGYPPYRLNTAAMDFAALTGSYGATVRAIKNALDPNGILAPGRYE